MDGLNVVYWLFQLFERFYPVFLTHWSIVLNSMPPVLIFGLCLPVYYLPPGAPFSVSDKTSYCKQVEAQLDYRPGSEIGVGWKIGVTWSRKRSFKTAATELGYLLTKLSFWLSLWHDISISWHGSKELLVWYVLQTMPSIRALRWCRYSTEKCFPDSPAICFRGNFVYISNLENWGDKSLDRNF